MNADGFQSRAQRLRRIFWATAVGTAMVLAGGLVGSMVVLKDTRFKLEQEQRYAERQQKLAEEARSWARAEQALAEQQAWDASVRQKEAEAAVDQASERQRAAERQKRRARAERLATTAEVSVEEDPQLGLPSLISRSRP